MVDCIWSPQPLAPGATETQRPCRRTHVHWHLLTPWLGISCYKPGGVATIITGPDGLHLPKRVIVPAPALVARGASPTGNNVVCFRVSGHDRRPLCMDLQFWSPSRAQPSPAQETELVPAIKDHYVPYRTMQNPDVPYRTMQNPEPERLSFRCLVLCSTFQTRRYRSRCRTTT